MDFQGLLCFLIEFIRAVTDVQPLEPPKDI